MDTLRRRRAGVAEWQTQGTQNPPTLAVVWVQLPPPAPTIAFRGPAMKASPIVEETWRLEDIFPADEAFWAEKARVDEALPGLARFQGGLGVSASAFADALEAVSGEAKALARLHAYASMRSDQDLRVASYQGM